MPIGIYKRTKKRTWKNSPEFVKKCRERKEDKSPSWKGDKAGYQALHMWIRKYFGQPSVCEHCKKKNLYVQQIHWANISGDYKRNRKDWKRLCAKCHKSFDKSLGRGYQPKQQSKLQ